MIINDDCIEQLKLFTNNLFDLILIDPPYGMDFQSGYRKEKHKKMEGDLSMDFLPDLFPLLRRVIKDNGHMYCFCSHHNIDLFLTEIKKVFKVKSILIWEKNNTGMGDLKGDYAPKTEFIIFVNMGKHLNSRRDPNILKFARTSNKLHPTEKPLDLFEFLIEKSTNEGDLVLDCFSGSGTTAQACINTKRKYVCIEKDVDFYKTSLNRIGLKEEDF